MALANIDVIGYELEHIGLTKRSIELGSQETYRLVQKTLHGDVRLGTIYTEVLAKRICELLNEQFYPGRDPDPIGPDR